MAESSLITTVFGAFMPYKHRPWYLQPWPIAAPRLIEIRNQLRREDLHDTEEPPLATTDGEAVDPARREERAIDGTFNDLAFPTMGSSGRRFGRNVPIDRTFPDTANVTLPSPRVVKVDLMTGLFAEPLPERFGFSETAFRVFTTSATTRC